MDFWLIVQQNGEVRRYRIDGDDVVVGQAPSCAIRIAQPSVSRRHARIRREGATLHIEDLGSTNGTRVNGLVIAHATELHPGVLVEFGSVSARVEQRDAVALPLRVDLPAEAAGGGGAATLSGDVLAAGLLLDVADWLQAMRSGDGAGELARRACAMLPARLPGLSLQVARCRPGRDDALLAGDVDDDAAQELVRAGFRLRWRGEPGQGFAAVAALLCELLALAEPSADAGSVAGAAPAPAAAPPPGPASVDPRILEIYRQAARIAPARDIAVLIEGESGTGKELLAAWLHQAAGGSGALVAVNCAALARDLLEAELFGVERGAATGVEARPGKFEQAQGGTLFLDEVGELAPEVQAKLLRVLQERKVARLGSQASRAIDVRIVAATNRSLRREVEAGRFRLDLYHRIADWTVQLPPLRERRGDLLALAAHFLERECRKRGLSVSGLSADALAVMKAHDWPGNVRELEREMMRAALFLDNGQVLDAAHLSERIRDPGDGGGRESALTREAIEAAIAAAGGNMSRAADQLGVARSTLYRRMKALAMDPG